MHEALLDEKLGALEKARAWSPRTISKLEGLIHNADDLALFRINPLRYATEKGLSEAEAIDLFLHATHVGLFMMEWYLVCGSCGTVVESFQEIARLHPHVVCNVCAAESDAYLDDYIHVGFTITPTVRAIRYHNPETLSMDERVLKYALDRDLSLQPNGQTMYEFLVSQTRYQQYLAPGETVQFTVQAEPGLVHASRFDTGANFAFAVTPVPAPGPQNVQITIHDDVFSITTPAMEAQNFFNGAFNVYINHFSVIPSGPLQFEVENRRAERTPFWMIQLPGDHHPGKCTFGPCLTGQRVLATQTFRDLFRTATTQMTESIGVRETTLLFTDLKGSTALYDQIGDPQAFFLVRQHFDALTRVVAQNNGAVVKTIGDAIMATFATPANAVRAAREMLAALTAFNQPGTPPLILKIGVHVGHSIVVTLNDRLDYFGQTVNIAARVQAQADAGELYLTQAVYDAAGVGPLLRDCTVEPMQAELRGVRNNITLYRVRVP